MQRHKIESKLIRVETGNPHTSTTMASDLLPLSKLTLELLLPLLLLLSLDLLGRAAMGARLTPATFSDDAVPTVANDASFPDGFLFGSASSSYQVEGAVAEGGKGPTNWDVYTAKYPERIADRSNGNVIVDGYHRYKEDVAIMKSIGLKAYRFSISWARILPNGTVNGGENEVGIAYYNNLIDELLANGIKPFVTLFHFDLPEALEKEYGGFLSSRAVKDFVAYADVCFKQFGDRVKHWVPINEPLSYSLFGYGSGALAPGRCSKWLNLNCTGGDSATEPYIVGHNLLLSHAAIVKLYRDKYQAEQKGTIGTAQVIQWGVPLSDSKQDHKATQRKIDFTLGWFQDPLATGDYPPSMRALVGSRLPNFTKDESEMLKGSFDFVGLNYYTSYYIFNAPPPPNSLHLNAVTDSQTNFSPEKNGVPIGPQAGISWQYIYPKGIREAVLYTTRKYNNTPIYITENGMGELNNGTLSLKESLDDSLRVDFYRQHIAYLNSAIKEGANVKGYFAWSLMDNFEWAEGCTIRFGIYYVDYKNGLRRYAKQSALWFRSFLKNHYKKQHLLTRMEEKDSGCRGTQDVPVDDDGRQFEKCSYSGEKSISPELGQWAKKTHLMSKDSGCRGTQEVPMDDDGRQFEKCSYSGKKSISPELGQTSKDSGCRGTQEVPMDDDGRQFEKCSYSGEKSISPELEKWAKKTHLTSNDPQIRNGLAVFVDMASRWGDLGSYGNAV